MCVCGCREVRGCVCVCGCREVNRCVCVCDRVKVAKFHPPLYIALPPLPPISGGHFSLCVRPSLSFPPPTQQWQQLRPPASRGGYLLLQHPPHLLWPSYGLFHIWKYMNTHTLRTLAIVSLRFFFLSCLFFLLLFCCVFCLMIRIIAKPRCLLLKHLTIIC